jgi:hypothetical protein
MPVTVKLGKKSPQADHRIMRMSKVSSQLPAPPADTNWYAEIANWYMLGNDTVGDCVEAAVLHCIEQFSTYSGQPLIPDEAEAMSFYEAATGYTPTNSATDQGSYVLGNGGVIEFWNTKGVTCGGKLNKVQSFLQIVHKNVTEWQQGIFLFGGMLTGVQLPEVIVSGDTVPSVWQDFSGPVAGGHEIWINGYETLNSGRYYDLVSWGQQYKATEEFLLHVIDEAVVVVDPVEINARGVDANNVPLTELLTYLKGLA